jgi:putative transcriptional regulator
MESLLDMRVLSIYRTKVKFALQVMRNEIRTLRTDQQLSQQQLAAAMDVSRQTINSIEKERYTPSLPLAIALARFFGKPVEEIFHGDGNA